MTASPPAAPGMPSDEDIVRIIRDWQMRPGFDGWDAKVAALAADVLSLIRPAFVAKAAEIERLAASWRKLDATANEWADRAHTAEAKLAKAVEALEPFAALANSYFYRYETQPGVFRECHQDDPDDRPVYGIDGVIINVGDLRRARSASAAARGEK
jgi:hypothetical protein